MTKPTKTTRTLTAMLLTTAAAVAGVIALAGAPVQAGDAGLEAARELFGSGAGTPESSDGAAPAAETVGDGGAAGAMSPEAAARSAAERPKTVEEIMESIGPGYLLDRLDRSIGAAEDWVRKNQPLPTRDTKDGSGEAPADGPADTSTPLKKMKGNPPVPGAGDDAPRNLQEAAVTEVEKTPAAVIPKPRLKPRLAAASTRDDEAEARPKKIQKDRKQTRKKESRKERKKTVRQPVVEVASHGCGG